MGEDAAAPKDMAAQLAAVLRVQGEKGREAWSQLHAKLAEVAAMASDDPRTAVQALLKLAKDASSSQALEERVSNIHPGLLKDLVRRVAGELNMTPLCDSEPIHMVDGDKNFCEQDVDRIIKRSADFSATAANYAVVSIIGAQNSGKSYLLNRLFGTKFPEMDATREWTKTTSGIMMSRCIWPSLLLLDVEGFDGVDNGKDTSFEKQAALFAITVSDLMIVNMNIGDICREHGGGSQLFRTIFQEMTKIEGECFTKILVVLRNFNGETPLDILRNNILKRLQQIWESVNGVSIKFEGYIEVDIFGMTHKDLAEFPKQVTELRRLVSANRTSKVPASSFSKSSRIYWDEIKKNKKLHIPSHQVLIARLFCQEIVKNIIHDLDSKEGYKLLKAEESPIFFKKISDVLLESITTGYDTETDMYDVEVRFDERKYMVEDLCKIFTKDANELIRRVQKKTLEQYKGVFDRNFQNMEEADADAYGERIVAECIKMFSTSFEDHKLFDSIYIKSISGELKEKMQSHIEIRILEMKERKAKEKYVNLKNGIIKGGAILARLAFFAATGSAPSS